MRNRLSKTEVARRHLGTALDLFLKDRDPVSVHTLAFAGAEVAEHMAAVTGAATFAGLAGEATGIALAEFRAARSRTANAFKHATRFKGQARDDSEILQQFSDEENDNLLFTGWYDLGIAMGKTPIEAGVFVAWYFARMEDENTVEFDPSELNKLFPAIRNKDRKKQKELLVRVITKLRRRRDLMTDHRTDPRPLVLGGWTAKQDA